MSARFRLLLPFLLACALSANATTLTDVSTGIELTVQPGGTFTINVHQPAWTFGGEIGQPLNNLSPRSGMDEIGRYREIVFHYAQDGAREGAIRLYQGLPIVLFSIKYLEAAKNLAPFPAFTQFPQGLDHLTYDGLFGKYSFAKFGSDSPWLFLDTSGNAFLLSPASHFLLASTMRKQSHEISAGIDPQIAGLPRGLSSGPSWS